MSIVVGVSAVLALAGSAGVVAWTYSAHEGRPVGSWQEPAEQQPPAGSGTPEPASDDPTVSPTEKGTMPAAPAAGQGRQQVGELQPIDKLVGYGAPEREVFRYPGASYVKVHFSRLAMLPGDYVTVADAQGRESYRYGAGAGRWAMSITGDTAVVQAHRGAAKAVGRPGVKVDRVARGYSTGEQSRIPAEQLATPGRTGREESVCGTDESTDAVCYRTADPVVYTRSRAIARLLINGTELCTGWRIGPRNRLVTNNHCLSTSANAFQTEVWFNYQCATCGGAGVFKPTKVWGHRVLATAHVLDFTLFTVTNFKAVRKFGYLTLDPVRPGRGQQLYVPQHPAGEPTRIAGGLGRRAGNCAVADPAFDGYARNSDVSYYCDTEGGSSGSPVLSRKTHKVVALHHFGGCPNSGVRGDLLNARIKSYL